MRVLPVKGDVTLRVDLALLSSKREHLQHEADAYAIIVVVL
jgi:hypothetical protein